MSLAMKQRWFFILLINALFLLQMSGQNNTSKGKKMDAKQKEQIQIDEKLASQYYRDQDYEKARDLYAQLYEKTEQTSHFQQYIDCLIFLKDYDKAEKELKSYAKKRPNYYRADTDLIYIYTLQGKTDKAKKLFNDVLKNLPENATTIRNYSYALQARGLNDLAMAILEKGNTLLEGKETLYMEQANLNLSTLNYQEAFKYYFKELEIHPEQYNNIRNRLQTMLFYDVNNSIADELRIALLKQTQDKPDNLDYAQLLVWFALQQEDYDIALAQCQSIDRKTHDQDAQINNLAGICLSNKQFDTAKEGYNYILDKGKTNPFYGQALTGVINADYQKLKAENHTDSKAYEKLSKRINEAYNEISTNDVSRLTLIQADIMAYHLDQADEAIALLTNTIEQEQQTRSSRAETETGRHLPSPR
jgi:tetratricopeptide (TPR) repeat protein